MGLAVGYYGKIPQYEDFISFDNSSDSSIIFQTWLFESVNNLLSRLGDSFETTYKKIPAMRMALRPKDAKNAIVATCMPSNDASGRKFPFSVFAELPQNLLNEHPHLIPESYDIFLMVARQCFENANQFFERAQQQNTMWLLREGLPKSIVPAQLNFASSLDTMLLGDILKSFSHDDQLCNGRKLIKNIIYSISTVRNYDTDGFKAMFRFPLPKEGNNHGRLMAFWIMVAKLLMQDKFQNFNLFWTDNYLLIAFGPASEKLLGNAWYPKDNDDNLWDFMKMNFDEKSFNPEICAKLENIINEEQKLIEFLSSLKTFS